MLNISGLKLPMIGDMLVGGKVYFVDSTNTRSSNDNNDGLHPNRPLATIAGAYAKCTADEGDFIVVMPKHAETITANQSMDTAGVSIIGIGNGDSRPTVTVNAAIEGWTICTADHLIHNIKMIPGSSSTIATRMFGVSGSAGNTTFSKCHFQVAAAEKMYHVGYVKGTVGKTVTFKNCLWENVSTVAIASVGTLQHTALLVRAGDVDVLGCRFVDMGAQLKNKWQQCIMAGSTGTGEDQGNVLIQDCVFNCRGVGVTARAAAVSANITILKSYGISTSGNTAVDAIFQATYANIVDCRVLGAVNKRAKECTTAVVTEA